MIEKLIKWLWDCQKQVDKLDSQLSEFGISLSLRCESNNFTNFYDALEIISGELPDDLSERMLDDFFCGEDFESFWQEYKEIFENVTECQQNQTNLPCDIGDTAYCVNGYEDKYIETFTVAEIVMRKEGVYLIDTNGAEWLARVCHFSRESAESELNGES